MSDDLAIAEIQQSAFEYRANFKEPITSFLHGQFQADIIKALQKALSPWSVGFENVSWNKEAKNVAEIQCTFGVPSLLSAIQVGVVGVTMSAFNVDWSRAPQLISLFQTATEVLKERTSQDFKSQLTTLTFHLKPAARPFRDIVSQFVNRDALAVNDASMYGVSVYADDYVFVIDGSAIVQGGVFIKLVRNFASDKRFEDMARAIYGDEEAVLRRLGMKLQ